MPRGKKYSEEVHEQARQLRREGFSLSEISVRLGMPKHTISGWVQQIKPTPEQLSQMLNRAAIKSERGRLAAAEVNRNARLARIDAERQKAEAFLDTLTQTDHANHIAAAMLYLGEGAKQDAVFAFANSNPQIIRYWIYLLRTSFAVDESKFRIRLFTRADQDPLTVIEYWTALTGISNCHRVEVDERTKNKSATYESYRGVCAVYYHDISLRRYLDALAASLMRRAINDPPA